MARAKFRKRFLITLGCCCFVAAAALGLYNRWIDYQSGISAAGLTDSFSQLLQSAQVVSGPTDPSVNLSPEEEGLAVSGSGAPLKTVRVSGYDISGSISLPAIKINLAVISEYSAEKMKISACRYRGTPTDRMIIVAHNYAKHFGKLGNLVAGDAITYTDAEGTVYEYQVLMTEIIDEADFSDILLGDEWDLTLFTCTYSKASRLVVRCKLK